MKNFGSSDMRRCLTARGVFPDISHMRLPMPRFYTPKGRSTSKGSPLPHRYNRCMELVPLYDGDENIGSVPLTTNLDMWDGMQWRHLHTGCHLGVGRLSGGRYYACYSATGPRASSGARKMTARTRSSSAASTTSALPTWRW